MATSHEAKLILRLVDGVSMPAKAVTTALAGVNRSIRSVESFGRSALGFAAGAVATAGLGRAMNEAVTDAVGLQAQLGEIGIKGDLGSGQVDGIARKIAELSGVTNQAQTELAAGIDAVMASGLGSDVAVKSIGLIGKTATASGAEVDDLSKTLSSLVQNLDVKPGAEMTKAFEALVQSGNDGAFELRDMAQYLPALSASAQALGMKGVPAVKELASWLQVARRGAGDSAEAANNLRNAMAKVMSPETIKSFSKLGINLPAAIAKGQKQGVSAIETLVSLTKKATNGGKADLLGQLFGDEQVRAFLRPAMADYEDFLKLREKASSAQGVIDRQYLSRMETAQSRLKRFNLAIENVGLGIGNALLDPLSSAADRVSRTLNTLASRAGILDRIGAGWKGFAAGLGAGAGGVADLYDAIDKAVFGDAATLEADSDRIGRIFVNFRDAGENVKAAVASFQAAAGLGGQMHALGDGVRALVDGFGAGGALAIAAGAAAIGRLGFGLGRLVLGGTAMRLGAVALGITALANSADGLSALDLVGLGVGLAGIAGPLLRIARGLAGIGKAGAAVAVLKEAAAVAGAALPPASAAVPSSGSGKAGGLGVSRITSTAFSALAGIDMLDTTPEAAAARSKALNKLADENIMTPSDIWKKFSASRSYKSETVSADARAALAGIVGRMGDGPASGIARSVEEEGQKAALAADAAGKRIADAFSVTVKPLVDVSSIEAASAAVARLAAGMAGLSGGKSSRLPHLSMIKPLPAVEPAIAGHRAAGGPMKAGFTYLVGEKGPETVTAGRNSYVTPNSTLDRQAPEPHMRNSITNKFETTVHFHGVKDTEEAARKIASALERQLNRSQQISMEGRSVG